MRKQFTKTLKEILYSDDKTVLLLGDIGVYGFSDELKNIPNRAYNIGILEQTTIGLAAGLSKSGLVPFVHTIAPFIVERALEQIKLDFGYQELNGNFISVGGSYDFTGLGCTHHCPADMSLLLTIPKMEMLIPGNGIEFDILIKQTYNSGNPTYTRISENNHSQTVSVKFGEANVIKQGTKATVVCFGSMLQQVVEATSDMDVTVLYYTTVSPFDEKTLLENFNTNIIVCEPFYEGTVNHLIDLAIAGKQHRKLNIGVPRKFLTNYGSKAEHDAKLGLDSSSIREKITSWLRR
jgi:transketolase